MKKKWNPVTLRIEALKYSRRGLFRKTSSGAYQAACTLGRDFLNDICLHMEPSQSEAYSDEEIREESIKYQRRADFAKFSPSIYNSAWKKGEKYLDKICAHMPKWSDRSKENSPFFKWTDEMLKEEAAKYSTIVDFVKNSWSAYITSSNKGREFLSLICSHMKPSRTSSHAERELSAAIKTVYDKVCKLRDTKVNIFNKPYIRGFEIDIFVPELNKGIEFDGIRYHSFDFMRKSSRKSKWSNEDIRNYHEIKDSWFASKGIQILHIKEEDWIKDKEACIQICLDFLSKSLQGSQTNS